jgi:hypothetical protein
MEASEVCVSALLIGEGKKRRKKIKIHEFAT